MCSVFKSINVPGVHRAREEGERVMEMCRVKFTLVGPGQLYFMLVVPW